MINETRYSIELPINLQSFKPWQGLPEQSSFEIYGGIRFYLPNTLGLLGYIELWAQFYSGSLNPQRRQLLPLQLCFSATLVLPINNGKKQSTTGINRLASIRTGKHKERGSYYAIEAMIPFNPGNAIAIRCSLYNFNFRRLIKRLNKRLSKMFNF